MKLFDWIDENNLDLIYLSENLNAIDYLEKTVMLVENVKDNLYVHFWCMLLIL